MVKHAFSVVRSPKSVLLVCGAAATLLVGCSKQKEASGQVVAKVNGTEISIYQLNTALGRAPGVTAQNAESFRGKVLDKLIDQQLAIGVAKEKELDRTPEVIQSLEEAKREILGRSYLDKVAATVPKTTDGEAKAFYAAHPELFGDRHVFQILELAMPAASNPPVYLLVGMMTTQSPEEIEKFLKEKKMEHLINRAVRAAETISPAAVKELAKLKVGQAGVVRTGGTISILKLVSSQSAPVDETVALPQIRQMLDNQKTMEAVTSELAQLRNKGKIEITGIEGKSAYAQKTVAEPAVVAAPAAKPAPAPAYAVKVDLPPPSDTTKTPAPGYAVKVDLPPPADAKGTPAASEAKSASGPAVDIVKGVTGLK